MARSWLWSYAEGPGAGRLSEDRCLDNTRTWWENDEKTGALGCHYLGHNTVFTTCYLFRILSCLHNSYSYLWPALLMAFYLEIMTFLEVNIKILGKCCRIFCEFYILFFQRMCRNNTLKLCSLKWTSSPSKFIFMSDNTTLKRLFHNTRTLTHLCFIGSEQRKNIRLKMQGPLLPVYSTIFYSTAILRKLFWTFCLFS